MPTPRFVSSLARDGENSSGIRVDLRGLRWANAAVYLVQRFVNSAVARNIAPVSRQHETLITPAPLSFWIWSPIYTLLTLAVVVDCFCPVLSLFSYTEDFVRLWFTVVCVGNIGWSLAWVNDYVQLATLFLALQWVALAAIFWRVIKTRREFKFSLGRYICSELGLTLYFAWSSAATVIAVAVSAQAIKGDVLTLSTYLVLLSVLVVAAIAALWYVNDVTYALVVIWALAGISSKAPSSTDPAVLQESVGVQAAAKQGAITIGVCIALMIAGRFAKRFRPQDDEAPEHSLPILMDKDNAADYGTGAV